MYKENLKKLREEQNLTQKNLATILNLEISHYAHLENEYEIMPIKHLITIADHLNVSIDYLFNLTNLRKYKNYIKGVNLILSGERLKNWRKKNNITQDRLAEKINIARSMVSKYEKGEFLIATHTLYEICKKYPISADYLLGKIEENPKH